MQVQQFLSQIKVETLSAALAVLTSMITPALLISACGTFILSTSNRLGRVVDRVRGLSVLIEDLMHNEAEVELREERRQMMMDQLHMLSERAQILQRTLTTFYMASGIFVSTSVALGMSAVFLPGLVWLPVALGILGACFLFYGSMLLIFEARIAVRSVAAEMGFMRQLVALHVKN